jgi:hypothetical protein
MQQFGLSKHPRAGNLADAWTPREGTYNPDPYTVVVNTGDPVVDLTFIGWHSIPAGSSSFIASKKQTEELGAEEASSQMAMAGPWEIEDHRTGEFSRS